MAQVDEGKAVLDADPGDASSSNAATAEAAAITAGKTEDAAAASTRYEKITDPEFSSGLLTLLLFATVPRSKFCSIAQTELRPSRGF